MGDRKVTNKYIPADFDPKLVPRGKKLSSKDGTVPVRMMLPFSIQCSTCNTFMYRGRKFNSKKESVQGAHGKYLGIQRYRFYIKCTQCARPVTFLTDPQNADYEMESGATRNFEVLKDNAKKTEDAEVAKEEEEKMDPMKALENRVLESQREMAEQDQLEEIRAMNARHITLVKENGFDADVQALKQVRETQDAAKQALTADDEALVKSIQFGSKKVETIHRLSEQDELKLEEKRKEQARQLEFQQQRQQQAAKAKNGMAAVIKVKRKRPAPIEKDGGGQEAVKQAKTSEMASLLGGYGSDSSDDSD